MIKSMFLAEAGEPIWELTNTDEDYYPLSGVVPKQVQSEESYLQLLFSADNFKNLAQIFFYMPLGLHLFGLGQMDMAWVLSR